MASLNFNLKLLFNIQTIRFLEAKQVYFSVKKIIFLMHNCFFDDLQA